ncbi:Xanthomonapepsin precursor [Minicystis rosea]|nr:Xanthomonapepsin precursor [Minicystis rosea]
MKTIRRSIRTLVPAAAALALTAATPGDARAMTTQEVGSTFVDLAVSYAFGYGADYALAYFFGTSSSSTSTATLSQQSLNDIKNILASQVDTQYQNDTKTLIDLVAIYHRGTTPTDLERAEDDAEEIWQQADELRNNFASEGLGGTATYAIVSSIYLAFLKEQHDIWYLQGTSGSSTLTARLNAIASAAGDIVSHLDQMNDAFDSRYGSVSVGMPPTNTDHQTYLPDCGRNNYAAPNAYDGDVAYCFSRPGGSTCGPSYYAYRCASSSTWHYDTTLAAKSEMEATIKRHRMMMADRDTLLGGSFFEGYENFRKIAAADFASCGDGVCSIGETHTCASDCAGKTQETGFFTPIVAAQTLLENAEAKLVWDGQNLSLRDKTKGNAQIWRTAIAPGNAIRTATFQVDGNLVLYDLNGVALWSTGTYDKGGAKLVLIGKMVYLVDSDATVLWSTATDPNHRAQLDARFCYDTSQATTLLENDKAQLDWKSNGSLSISRDGSEIWSSGTSGAGKWLCNQDDGNLVIYSATDAVWSSSVYVGLGGHLVLEGDRLLSTTAGGQHLWETPACTAWSCAPSLDPEIATKDVGSGFCLTTSQPQTLLSTKQATLEWQSDGNLVVYDNTITPRKAPWATDTDGVGRSVCMQSDGNLVIYDAGGTALWASDTTANDTKNQPAARMVLASCNFYLADASTGRAHFRSNTTCRGE